LEKGIGGKLREKRDAEAKQVRKEREDRSRFWQICNIEVSKEEGKRKSIPDSSLNIHKMRNFF
jgi:hypothetical protein